MPRSIISAPESFILMGHSFFTHATRSFFILMARSFIVMRSSITFENRSFISECALAIAVMIVGIGPTYSASAQESKEAPEGQGAPEGRETREINGIQETQEPTELSVRHDAEAGTIEVFVEGSTEPVVTQHARAGDRPYIHPIIAPDGNGVLTQYRPEHHPHQTGLYWGLKELNGRDYFMQWRDEYYRRVSAHVVRKRGPHVRWQTVYDLLGADGRPILTETQNWTMQQREDVIMLDLEWTGEALADVMLEQFYVGGLFLRMPWHPGADGDVANASGLRNGDAEGQRAIWTDVGVEIDGRTDHGHIAIFDHPDNEAFPVPWRVDNELGVGPSRQILGSWGLDEGERTTIRYRLLVYTGARDPEELTRRWTQYAAEK